MDEWFQFGWMDKQFLVIFLAVRNFINQYYICISVFLIKAQDKTDASLDAAGGVDSFIS